jgi:CRP-like cAMP-binding protein
MQRKAIGSDGASRLAKLKLFAGLSAGRREMLARLLDEVIAEPGETVMREDEPGYEVLILEEGTADVLQRGSRVNVLGSGDILGELAVLATGAARTATVVATSPLRAIVLTSHSVRAVRERMPSVAEQIDRAAAEHLARDQLERSAQAESLRPQ